MYCCVEVAQCTWMPCSTRQPSPVNICLSGWPPVRPVRVEADLGRLACAQLKAEDEGAAAELKRLLRSTAAVYRTLLSHAEAARVEVILKRQTLPELSVVRARGQIPDLRFLVGRQEHTCGFCF